MSLSPNSNLVRRTIDLNYDNKQRSASLKWIFINSTLFLLLIYDLWSACPGQTGALHYAEACLCAAAAASALTHARRVVPAPWPWRRAPLTSLTRTQLSLLGLRDDDLDSSFRVTEASPPRMAAREASASETEDVTSLSPARSWRSSPPRSAPPSPPSPRASPPSPPSPVPDEFIADPQVLDRYLRERERVECEDFSGIALPAPGGAWGQYAGVGGAPPAYRVSPLQAGGGEGGDAGEESPPAPVWRRLHLDPHHISQFDLNLRRWLHATIVERVAREMAACDALLAGAGQEARVGAASPARLEALCAGAGPPLGPRLRRLLPFLRPFADQQWAAARVRELARSACLAAYRWDVDAELVLHLFATYVDGVVPERGAFSARHVSAAPAPPPRGAGALALHRVARAPPHYVLALGAQTAEVARGRDNLLHSLLLLLAAAARGDPPALCRLHLGPAGLNLLWVLAR